MTNWWPAILAALLLGASGWLIWWQARAAARRLLREARREAERLEESARREADARLREAELQAKEKLLQARSEFEAVSRQRRGELESLERRLDQREETLERRQLQLEQRERELSARDREVEETRRSLAAKAEELEERDRQVLGRLEQVAGMTAQQAREELLKRHEEQARLEAAQMVRRIEEEAREQGQKKAQWLIALAAQRQASDYIAETAVSVIELPSDEMKGRIIGREGRNIRALEMATGIDLIVDDTPEAVILSGFDPFRREVARLALERLIADGRIHPARIEEVVEKVRSELDQKIRQEGEAALLELKIPGMHPELVKLLGRLRYRFSYGQNVLHHSKEVAWLAATMAAELKANVAVAKRAGLLHDIGKAIDRETEGTHLELGIELLRRYGESEEVVHAMACHHGDYEPRTVEAVLVTAADALSAGRPGARREVLETYVQRLRKLEEIAASFQGVQKSYAIQAGREIRIVVDSGKISDEEAIWLSKEVARKIESELTYPGQIRVTVIRETRAVEIAR